MASPSSEPTALGAQNSQSELIRQILFSRWTFVGLQVLDLLTTLYAFHTGALEVNPLVAHLTMSFGYFRGVLISKLIAVAIGMGVRKRLWIVNILYVGIVVWNLIMIAGMALHAK
jgi:hypothetical protein